MKAKDLSVMTFMSWENAMEEGLRAIALCDDTGWFHVAINCVRDGDMGVKDKNGVYSRKWYGDSIFNGIESATLRPATHDEVALYLQYVPIDEAIGNVHGESCYEMVHMSVGNYCSSVVVHKRPLPWYKKLWNKMRVNKALPF